MPNGEQALEQYHEGEDSAEESGEWESPADDDEDESDESDEEEVGDSPSRSERRSTGQARQGCGLERSISKARSVFDSRIG